MYTLCIRYVYNVYIMYIPVLTNEGKLGQLRRSMLSLHEEIAKLSVQDNRHGFAQPTHTAIPPVLHCFKTQSLPLHEIREAVDEDESAVNIFIIELTALGDEQEV